MVCLQKKKKQQGELFDAVCTIYYKPSKDRSRIINKRTVNCVQIVHTLFEERINNYAHYNVSREFHPNRLSVYVIHAITRCWSIRRALST